MYTLVCLSFVHLIMHNIINRVCEEMGVVVSGANLQRMGGDMNTLLLLGFARTVYRM